MKMHQSISLITIALFSLMSFSAAASELPTPPACGTSADYQNNPRLPGIDSGTTATSAQLAAASQALEKPVSASACSQQEKNIYILMAETCHIASVKAQGTTISKQSLELISNCTNFYNQWLHESAAK